MSCRFGLVQSPRQEPRWNVGRSAAAAARCMQRRKWQRFLYVCKITVGDHELIHCPEYPKLGRVPAPGGDKKANIISEASPPTYSPVRIKKTQLTPAKKTPLHA